MKKLTLVLDYYGNRSYGKRAYWFLNEEGKRTNQFVFRSEIKDFIKEMKKENTEVILKT